MGKAVSLIVSELVMKKMISYVDRTSDIITTAKRWRENIYLFTAFIKLSCSKSIEMSITTSNSKQITRKDASDLKNYYENSYAVIIGINQYQEESPLNNAGNDARAVMKVLEKTYGFITIKSLFNQEATGDQIREIFYDTLQDEKRIGPKDRVIVYYSGHGKLRTILGRGGEEIKEGFIVPYDSKREKFGSNIPMETIINGCQKCPAKHVLLILDCCYSGFAATRAVQPPEPQRATDDYIKDISSRIAMQILAAGQEDQPVSDSGTRPGYSAFTGALLDILEPERDLDDNGILTASEIGFNLARQVATQVQRGSYQRPVYKEIAGSEGGDFIFKIFRIQEISSAPTADNKEAKTEANIPVEIRLTGSDPDPEDTLKFSIIDPPQHGTLRSDPRTNSIIYTPGFSVIYTPSIGFSGADNFTYKATDKRESDSNIATVNITVKPQSLRPVQPHQSIRPIFTRNPLILILVSAVVVAGVLSIAIFHLIPSPVNQPPIANPGSNQMVNPGDTVTLDGSKSSEPGGTITSYIWKQIPSKGPKVSIYGSDTANPSFIAPRAKLDTKLAFDLIVKDDKGITSPPSAVDIIVKAGPPLSIPIALNQSVTTSINKVIDITLRASDQNPNANLTVAIVTNPSHGTLGKINENTGDVTYTPTSGFSGTDKFTFKVNDGKVDSDNVGTVDVKIENPPIALNQSVTTSINKVIDITLRASDQNPNANLTVAIVTNPSHGTLGKINENTGDVTYTPDQGFQGDDSFTFKVNDRKVDSNDIATVKIRINGLQ